MFLYINKITKAFGHKSALQDVTIEIEQGDTLGLLGPNGAGKTTLIRSITGISLPDSGQISMNGASITEEDRRQIGYLPEERGLYPEMRIGEQLVYLAQLKGMSRREARRECDFWLERLTLSSRKESRTNELSKGMQQKIQFISAVIHKPRLLILDEPFSGLDPINAEIIKKEILRLKKEGTTIILSTHDMESVEELCDKVALINQSRIILDGTIHQVKDRYKRGEFLLKTRNTENTSVISDYFSILSVMTKGDFIEWRIEKKETKMDNNSFIKELMRHFQIISIEEQTPSMNDIFLLAVKNENSNNHE